MNKPTKPFLKPFSQTPPAAGAAQKAGVTLSELSIQSIAAGMPDPADRAAFLARACAGNDALREKIERRLAANAAAAAPAAAPATAVVTPTPAPMAAAAAAPVSIPAATPPPAPATAAIPTPGPATAPTAAFSATPASTPPPAPQPAPAPVHEATLHRIPEPTLAIPQNQPAGMALVPMSASQLAAITAQRSNTFPWLTAVILAVAAGALAVFLIQEKDARKRAEDGQHQAGKLAETAAKEAADARAAAEKEREATTAQVAAARTESEKLRATAEEQRQRADAATKQAALAKAEADRLAKEIAAKKSEDGASGSAAVKAREERDAARATQRETALALAATLAKLAATQLDNSRHADAEASARRSLELRLTQAVEGWPLVESRALLGAALLQKNADAEAAREFSAAAADIEKLGAPATDADRASLIVAARRIVQFHNATGRRKEAFDLKRKYDALAKP